jgi:hypothetical protein
MSMTVSFQESGKIGHIWNTIVVAPMGCTTDPSSAIPITKFAADYTGISSSRTCFGYQFDPKISAEESL